MQATFDMIRRIRETSRHTGRSNFGGFVAARMARAFNQPTLLGAIEDLARALDSDVQYVGGAKASAFLREAQGADGPRIHLWMRNHPSLVAMISGLQDQSDRNDALAHIVLPELPAGQDEADVMVPPEGFDIRVTVTATTGLAHGADSKAGNATLYRRRTVLTPAGRHLSLPIYAGNALRGQLRDTLADHVMVALGLTANRTIPAIDPWLFQALYAGGALESASKRDEAAGLGGGGAVGTDGIRRLRVMLPGLSVLGTAIGSRIINGRVSVCDLRPRCREWGTGPAAAAELFDWVYLTRRDDYDGRVDDDVTSAMIAETEALKPGVVLDGGIDIDSHATEVERAALARGLILMAERGQLGAENRRGLGRVVIEYEGLPDPAPYDQYLADHAADILAYIDEIGGRTGAVRPKKQKKGQRKAASKAPAAEAAQPADPDDPVPDMGGPDQTPLDAG